MASSALRVLSRSGARRFDACIDMEFFARFSAAIAYLTGARQRVGFHVYFGEGPYRGDLMTHRVLYNPHLHTSRTFTSLVLALDADPGRAPDLRRSSRRRARRCPSSSPSRRGAEVARCSRAGRPPGGRLVS
jgi:hypothetical protein